MPTFASSPEPVRQIRPTAPTLASPVRRPLLRPPAAAPTPACLRPAAAVSAEISPDGAGGELECARDRVLRWIEAQVGPLPGDFEADRRLPEPARRFKRHRAAEGLVEVGERVTERGRSFTASLEAGGAPGRPSWKALVVLEQSPEASRLQATLLTRRRALSRPTVLWVPGIVHGLAEAPGLIDYGWRILPKPWIIEDEEGVEELTDLLGDPDRTRPVFATGLAAGQTNPEDAPVDPWDLAHRTVGLAHVVVVTGPMTFALSDRVGRRFSVFGNALRTYRPGCVIGARALEHPMALPETVRNWSAGGPHDFALFLTREAARTSLEMQADSIGSLSEAREAQPRRPALRPAPEPDPFALALLDESGDGDGLHPIGAGEDAEPAVNEAQSRPTPLRAARAG